MAATFLSSDLQAVYLGTNTGAPASSTQLTAFRTDGDAALDIAIENLDKRIATFETVLIGSTSASGKTSAEYPYDRAGLRREFLDELAALLLRRGYHATGILTNANSLLDPITGPIFSRGDDQTTLVKNATTGTGNFGNLATDVPIDSDPRLELLTTEGRSLFRSYAALIDAVFAEGDKLGAAPARQVQVTSAIQPIVVDGVTYDRVAQTTGVDPATGNPTYNSFLLEAGADPSRVAKDSLGNATLLGPSTSAARRLLLSPSVTTLDSTTGEYRVLLDGAEARVTATPGGILFRLGTTETAVAAEAVPALLLNVPQRGHEFPEVRIQANYRVTASNGATYLIGLSTEGEVYVTSLAAARSSPVDTVASMSGLEYLLYFNEVRIKYLRAQLAYKEGIVREIQEDLKQANSALADVETRAGLITATNTDGTETGQQSADTFELNLFGATHSTAGKPLLTGTADSHHDADGWTTIRVNVKNYIDRRSAEAQEATLDYQNVLNRFNNALEVMAKLQEKLDTLLKAQLRNLA